MNLTQVARFHVIGISTRTRNADEMSGHSEISALWSNFYEDAILSRIPGRTDNYVIAVYTDYESDKDGAYTLLIGARVNPSADIPEGMRRIEVPAGNYAVFTSNRGPVPQVVPQLWQQIWSSPIDRAYKADFEVYDQRAADPNDAVMDAVMDVYVGVA